MAASTMPAVQAYNWTGKTDGHLLQERPSKPALHLDQEAMRESSSEAWRRARDAEAVSMPSSAAAAAAAAGPRHASGSIGRYNSQGSRRHVSPRPMLTDDEIIQDGLGSDELIPSEWATGSSARFAPKTHTQHSNGHFYDGGSPSRQVFPQSSRPQLSVQHSNTSLRPPPSPMSPGTLEQARERARRLAREREVSNGAGELSDDETFQLVTMESDGHTSTTSGQVQTTSCALTAPPVQKANGNISMSGNKSTTSSPSAIKGGNAKMAVKTPQHVLDEFGPLGGPARKPTNHVHPDATAEFGATRSVSNPWDEEYIPTVKRRMEQERLMNEANGSVDSDILYHTWDKNGLPLEKSQILPATRQRTELASGQDLHLGKTSETPPEDLQEAQRMSREERFTNAVDSRNTPIDCKSPLYAQPPSPSTTHESDAQAHARRQRLTQELDFGFGRVQSPTKRVHGHTNEKPQQPPTRAHGQEMPDKAAPNSAALTAAAAKQIGTANPEPAKATANTSHDVADDAGCCKCTIM